MTKDRSLTDDLTQDVFVRAFVHGGRFRGEATEKTWLFRIARNLCIDHARSAFVRRITLVEWISGGPSASAEEEFLRRVDQDAVRKAVYQLKRMYREVVVLHALNGFSFQDIAETVGAAEGTVRARYRRALNQLRNSLIGEVGSSRE